LTLALADQLGGTHEDEAVDEHVVTMQQFRLGGNDGAVLPLLRLADEVVAAGTQLITHMAQHHGYRPRHFRVEPVESPAPEAEWKESRVKRPDDGTKSRRPSRATRQAPPDRGA
jgi:hypothetical protein